MFKLKKLYPPFGTKDSPVLEASYSEGIIKTIDGICEVQFPETRDRLIKLGYEEIKESGATPEQTDTTAKQKSYRKTIKKRR